MHLKGRKPQRRHHAPAASQVASGSVSFRFLLVDFLSRLLGKLPSPHLCFIHSQSCNFPATLSSLLLSSFTFAPPVLLLSSASSSLLSVSLLPAEAQTRLRSLCRLFWGIFCCFFFVGGLGCKCFYFV